MGIGDFIERAGARGPSDLRRKLARFLLHNMARDHTVAAMMSPPPVIARTDMHIAELIPHFGREMCHHIPVVDEAQRYVGMVSQSALIAALYRSRLAEGASAAGLDRGQRRAPPPRYCRSPAFTSSWVSSRIGTGFTLPDVLAVFADRAIRRELAGARRVEDGHARPALRVARRRALTALWQST
ncbi:MAG: CBS domain-containing protein [Comamonadaceae bacterium]|nr:CBS domain-containing protein [Comamonadaceae bacterium]